MYYPIKHIGNVFAICNKNISTFGGCGSLREDLPLKRYEGLGVTELFVNEKPYRICKKCLAVIFRKENRYNKEYSDKKWNFYYKRKPVFKEQ